MGAPFATRTARGGPAAAFFGAAGLGAALGGDRLRPASDGFSRLSLTVQMGVPPKAADRLSSRHAVSASLRDPKFA